MAAGWTGRLRDRARQALRRSPTAHHLLRGYRPATPVPLSRPVLKAALINWVAARHGRRRFLEISTNTTGWQEHLIEVERFRSFARLVYNTGGAPARAPATVTVPGTDISEAVARLGRRGPRPDLVFVDSHHTYRHSRRDLDAALSLMAPGGVMIVHDCLPPTATTIQPAYVEGAWHGMTFKAFYDVALDHPEHDYVTVDCDEGCGVVVKAGRIYRRGGADLPTRAGPDLAARWLALGEDGSAAHAFLAEHPEEISRLISAKTFLHELEFRAA